MMPARPYDAILAGGGLAGLSLAYQWAHSPLREDRLLIVDHDAKQRNDRTWCYWATTARPTAFDGIVHREWRRVRIYGEQYGSELDLGDYRYRQIRGIDFYRFVRQELSALPNVQFLRGHVEDVRDIPGVGGGARVTVDGQVYEGRWAFDSRFHLSQFRPPAGYVEGSHSFNSSVPEATCHDLRQYFRGWRVETQSAAFDPSAATFMDFRTPQQGAMRFFYVLPETTHEALVEYVTLAPDNHEAAFGVYAGDVLGLREYSAVPVEGGVIPLTDYVFPRRLGEHVMAIGVRGGRVKPTTGFAFLRIQHDCAAIVQSLVRHGQPFDVPAGPARYRLCDCLMLELMQRHGDHIKPIFTALFRNNPLPRVLRFLDEQATPAENALLIATLPPRLFLQALARYMIRRIDERVPNGYRNWRGHRRYNRGGAPRA